MYVIIPFCGEETAGVERDRVYPVGMFLCDNHTECVSRCIGVHDEWLCPIGCFEHWFTHADLLQPMEGCLAVFRPVPLAVFTREIVEWSAMLEKSEMKAL